MTPMFDPDALHRAVTDALNKAPEGHRNAFVVVATTSGGVQAVLAHQVNDNIEIEAIWGLNERHKPEAEVAVRATW